LIVDFSMQALGSLSESLLSHLPQAA